MAQDLEALDEAMDIVLMDPEVPIAALLAIARKLQKGCLRRGLDLSEETLGD